MDQTSKKITCSDCGKKFLVIAQEQDFLQRKNLPLPTQCPTCRQAVRLALRNERKMYNRKCDKCGQTILATFSDDVVFPVYCQKCFWEYIN